jgi:hypothetical protein
MLDFVGAPVPEGCEGVSLRGVCRDGDVPTKSLVRGFLQFQGRQLAMTLSDRYKLCTFDTYRGGGIRLDLGRAVELYDMQNDPNELNDLFGRVDNDGVRELIDEHLRYFGEYHINLSWVCASPPDQVNVAPRPRSEMVVPDGRWFEAHRRRVEAETECSN